MKKKLLFASLIAAIISNYDAVVHASKNKNVDRPYEIEISVGGTIADELDKKEHGAKGASEYSSIYDRNFTPYLSGKYLYLGNNFDLFLSGTFQDSDEQNYYGRMALNRVFIYKGEYIKFLHRLEHDNMKNLMAHIFRTDTDGPQGKGDPTGLPFPCPDPSNPKFCAVLPDLDPNTPGYQNHRAIIGAANVYHTDHDPNDKYEISYSEWINKFKVNLPNLPSLKVGLDHRLQQRKGCKQAQTNSKCSGCHVESFSKSIDETTTDISPYVDLQMGPLAIKYTYTYREFDDDSERMYNVYNFLRSDHVAPFISNLQFDGTEGPLPFARTPDSKKHTHTLSTRLDVTPNNIFNTTLVYSKISNESTVGRYNILFGKYDQELQMDSLSFMAKWHTRFSKNLTFNIYGRYQDVDNDEVFVDVNDNNHVPTLSTGISRVPRYQFYGLKPGYWDFVRKSGYDKETYEAGFDFSYRMAKGFYLKGGYDYMLDHRDNYHEYHVPEDTISHTFKLSGDWYANRKTKVGLGYKLYLADDAYAAHKSMCPPWGDFKSYVGPATPISGSEFYKRSYYPALYSKRKKDGTNQPDLAHEIDGKLNFMPSNMVSTNIYGKYRYAENSEIKGHTWKQDLINAGLSVVATPNKKLAFTGGYNYFFDAYESKFCIAIYDG